ncbi:DUF7017 domain-containing protein [Saccharibacillus sacchari]|uniref:DUF7017 domain-containing protein n=1 Tax=Saccharibacillus sacchari TaxID=456493 RepID=UPI0004B3B6F5|nr:hypothetical protein [Saccharibacillus sacchari]
MYTEKDLQKDVYHICSTHYVKYKMLADYVYNRINRKDFIEELSEQKGDDEIDGILARLDEIVSRIRHNGGKLDPDPLKEANKLRKAGKLKEAYDLVFPLVESNSKDEDAVIGFGWVMHDFLKHTENDIEAYCVNLKIFNDYAYIDFHSGSEMMTRLKNSFLWSIRRVVQRDESNANKVFELFINLCKDEETIFEQRRSFGKEQEKDPARLLIEELIATLNARNYLRLTSWIGFDWFDRFDHQASTFENAQGETIENRPFAEKILSSHAKKLIALDSAVDKSEIDRYISVLERNISKFPNYEWLPYHKIKLLLMSGRKEEALSDLTEFARRKSGEFWIWGLMSETVPREEEFRHLCKGLLCKAKPEMLVKLQEKIIPHLLELNLYENAKFELDAYIKIKESRGRPAPSSLSGLRKQEWYERTKAVSNRDGLKKYAEEAEAILYKNLPFETVFVTRINGDKGFAEFIHFPNRRSTQVFSESPASSLKEGFFRMDSIKEAVEWKADRTYKLKMSEDSKRPNRYHVHAAALGDEESLADFIRNESGYVEKEDRNPFAFANDVFIPAALVDRHRLSAGDKIEYIKKRRFNKKKNAWGWTVEEVKSVVKYDQDNGIED